MRHFQLKDGLSSHMAERMIEDSQGFIWVGTYSGLLKYDGYEFIKVLDGKIGAILEDRDGYIWVGTQENLWRYDPRTNQKKSFYYKEQKPPDRWYDIVALAQDHTGSICVGTAYNCLVRLVPQSKDVYAFYNYPCSDGGLFNNTEGPTDTLAGNWLWNVVTAENGTTWIGTSRGMSELIITDPKQPESVQFQYTHLFNEPDSKNETIYINSISIGLQGRLWVVARSSANNGIIFNFDPDTRTSIEYTHNQDPSIVLRYIHEDQFGNLWNGPYSDGLQFIAAKDIKEIDNQRKKINQYKRYLFTTPGDVTIATNNVQGIMEDKYGTIWVLSNFMGIYQIPVKLNVFQHIKLPKKFVDEQNEVSSVVTSSDDIWIATWSNGLYHYTSDLREVAHFTKNSPQPLSNIISSVFLDSKKRIWALTDNQSLHLYNPINSLFTPFQLAEEKVNKNYFDFLSEACEDKKGHFWIGSGGQGLFHFDPNSKKVIHHFHVDHQKPNGLKSDIITEIICDKDGIVWAGSPYQGLISIQQLPNGEYQFDRFLPDIPLIGEMLIDSKERLWITTYAHGLILFDRKEKRITKTFSIENGLPNNNIYSITEDKTGLLWLTTSTGLVSLNPADESIRLYDKGYGFEFSQKVPNGADINVHNQLIFGGNGGFYKLDLNTETLRPEQEPQVVFTQLSINNEIQNIGSENSVLDSSLQFLKNLTLRHDQNNLEISFAGIQYDDPENVEYAYLLENYHNTWQRIGSQRIARMSNLDPGNYVFKVKASLEDYHSEQKLSIEILSPVWWRWWAKTIYFCLGVALLGVYATFRKKLRRKQMEVEKISSLQKMRSRFFANISHEFRTPLTLIKGPLEDQFNNATTPVEKQQLAMMHQQTNRMLKLVDELLDLSKVDRAQLEIRKKSGDIYSFLKTCADSFLILADDLKLRFEVALPHRTVVLLFDPDNLEKIVINLLSNALKFAGSNGIVRLSASYIPDQGILNFTVTNDGEPIPEDEIATIFDQFFQARNASRQGSGVGLALVKELVELMSGKISVTSSIMEGTTFKVEIPMDSGIIPSSEFTALTTVKNDLHFKKEQEHLPSHKSRKHRAQILVVDDSPEICAYIRSLLIKEFLVIEAENGKAGWRLTKEKVPDLIVSDVMMPEMDGVELCYQIKSDLATDHIPVILLTAKADIESRIEGLESGADDYISKPFSPQEFLARVNNLIVQRENLKKRFKQHIQLDMSDIVISSAEQQFLKKALQIIKEEIANPDFSVEKFSDKMNLSRTHLHKKLKAVTDQSPSEFIRNLRLQRASELLLVENDNVSQVAYSVGFNNLSYFTKCFKEKYKVPPSEYIAHNISK